MDRKRITTRTGERLLRAAYDYNELASRLKDEGHGSEGEWCREIANQLHKLGHQLQDKLEQR